MSAAPQMEDLAEASEVEPLEELIQFLATNDARTDMDQWRRAELILKTLAPKLPQANASPGSSARARSISFSKAEAHAVAGGVADEIARRGILVDGRPPAERTLLTTAEVAYVWVPDDRVAGANFEAHKALRSPKYDGTRSAVLQRLRSKNKNGRVTAADVKMWRSEKLRQKRTPLTFQELFDRRIVHAIAAQVRPSFSATTQEDLDAMAATLRRRAEQLTEGIQPKETN